MRSCEQRGRFSAAPLFRSLVKKRIEVCRAALPEGRIFTYGAPQPLTGTALSPPRTRARGQAFARPLKPQRPSQTLWYIAPDMAKSPTLRGHGGKLSLAHSSRSAESDSWLVYPPPRYTFPERSPTLRGHGGEQARPLKPQRRVGLLSRASLCAAEAARGATPFFPSFHVRVSVLCPKTEFC